MTGGGAGKRASDPLEGRLCPTPLFTLCFALYPLDFSTKFSDTPLIDYQGLTLHYAGY